MGFKGIALVLLCIIFMAYQSTTAMAGCNTLVSMPDNFTSQTPPTPIGGFGHVSGQIRDYPSNCPWILPINVALVNVTGFSVLDHGWSGVSGTIGVYYGPFSCTPTDSYTISFVKVSGTGNITYKVVAYYKIPDSGKH